MSLYFNKSNEMNRVIFKNKLDLELEIKLVGINFLYKILIEYAEKHPFEMKLLNSSKDLLEWNAER